ncbi:aldo/keto reductase [Oceanicola sp. 22II-s10i]|uniref:aldo/keto reductase n=1 Tax=Oceanicola sp. 22II-s10i TaxID=1317116 RepID=UPI000B528207|nr:aldo/keto reductase [Oceanicola sp. 22II-s10i]OWU83313.1 aldo/keto reductase [Oceanicola sp. 22II-s10i]
MSFPKRQLGAGGPMVGAVGFGAMSFAGFFGAADDATSLDTLDAAFAAGIDFWDTSNMYGLGRSEAVLGEWLKTRGENVTIATKGGIIPGPPRRIDNTAGHLREELEKSLKKLNRDKVELYYIHRRDHSIEVEAVVETLVSFIEEGLIDGYGLSEIAPHTLRRAHAVHPCRAVQNEYSLWSRQPELGLIRLCKELGVAFVPFSPLARGMLGETSVDPAGMAEGDFRRANPRFQPPNYAANVAAIDGFRAFAKAKGTTTAALALAWILDRGDHLIPIPGTRTVEHLNEWLDAATLSLTDADRAEIDRLLPAGFAHGDRYADNQMMAVERYC